MAEVYLECCTPETVDWSKIPAEYHEQIRREWNLPSGQASGSSTAPQNAPVVIDLDDDDSDHVLVGAAAASLETVKADIARREKPAERATEEINVPPMTNTINPIASRSCLDLLSNDEMDDLLQDLFPVDQPKVPEEVKQTVEMLLSSVCTMVAESQQLSRDCQQPCELDGIQKMQELQRAAAKELCETQGRKAIVYRFDSKQSYLKGDRLRFQTTWGVVQCCLPKNVCNGQFITFSVPRPENCSDSLEVIGRPIGMYGADKKCDARIRARASRKRKKMEAASTEQSFQPTAMNPLQLLTDTAAKQTPAKQQHAAKDPHSCTEGSDFEDEERPLPKADDGPSVYSKDPKCSI